VVGRAERPTLVGPFALRLRLRLLKAIVPISRFLPSEFVLPSFSGHRLLRAVGEVQAPGTIGPRGSGPHPARPQDRLVASIWLDPTVDRRHPFRGPKPDGYARIRTPFCALSIGGGFKLPAVRDG